MKQSCPEQNNFFVLTQQQLGKDGSVASERRIKERFPKTNCENLLKQSSSTVRYSNCSSYRALEIQLKANAGDQSALTTPQEKHATLAMTEGQNEAGDPVNILQAAKECNCKQYSSKADYERCKTNNLGMPLVTLFGDTETNNKTPHTLWNNLGNNQSCSPGSRAVQVPNASFGNNDHDSGITVGLSEFFYWLKKLWSQ